MSKIEKINKVEFTPLDNISHQRENQKEKFKTLLEEKKNKQKVKSKKELAPEKNNKENAVNLEKNKEVLLPSLDLSLLQKQRNSLNKDTVFSDIESSTLSREKLKNKVESLYIKTFEEKKNILK